MHRLFFFLFPFTLLLAQDPVVYTIEGKKDPRLEAVYRVLYVSTGTSEECTTRKLSTGTKKPVIGVRTYAIKDENYSIQIPIALTEDENNCGYRLSGLELMILRKNDQQNSKYDHHYSRFWLFGDYKNKDIFSGKELGGQRADVVYMGDWGGAGSPSFVGISNKQTPIAFMSNKKYFRIAPETTFVCMTQHYTYEFERSKQDQELSQKFGDTDFMCMIKMKLDTEGGKYHYHECPVPAPMDSVGCFTTTNPDFGVDEITSDTLHIDILVDESKCKVLRHLNRQLFELEPDMFREISKPIPSAIDSIKSLF